MVIVDSEENEQNIPKKYEKRLVEEVKKDKMKKIIVKAPIQILNINMVV